MTVPLLTPSESALDLGRLALDAIAKGQVRLAHFEAKRAARQAVKELETVTMKRVTDPEGKLTLNQVLSLLEMEKRPTGKTGYRYIIRCEATQTHFLAGAANDVWVWLKETGRYREDDATNT